MSPSEAENAGVSGQENTGGFLTSKTACGRLAHAQSGLFTPKFLSLGGVGKIPSSESNPKQAA